jgi:hypothetical protein
MSQRISAPETQIKKKTGKKEKKGPPHLGPNFCKIIAARPYPFARPL